MSDHCQFWLQIFYFLYLILFFVLTLFVWTVDNVLFSRLSWFCFIFVSSYSWNDIWVWLPFKHFNLFIFRDNLTWTIVGFWNHIFFSKTEIHLCWTSSLLCHIVTSPSSSIKIIISFKPLNELKIVLIFCFCQLLHFYISLDPNFVKCRLKDLKIWNKFIIVFSFPVNLVDGDFTRMNDIDDLAVNSSRSKLLNFVEI